VDDSQIGSVLSIRLSFRRALSLPEDRLVEQWNAALYLSDEDDDEQVIGNAHIVRCRLGDPRVFDLLDALDGDLSAVGSVVLDPSSGEPAGPVEDLIEGFGENFLILDRVELLPGWRGRGLGRWFAAEAIEVLSDGGTFVAAYAAPMDDSEGAERRRAESKLKGVWGDIGFEPLRGNVMVLDLALVTLSNKLAELRSDFGVH
jgi:GNAT superfamily N-acetyltransferase